MNGETGVVVLTAADVGAAVAPTIVRRTTDLERTSTATLADDPVLTFSAATDKLYKVEAMLIFSAGSDTPDVKVGINAPTGATINMRADGLAPATTTSVGPGRTGYLTATTDEADFGLITTRMVVPMVGYIRTSSTAGNIAVRWAQRASNATATTLHADSCLCVTLIA